MTNEPQPNSEAILARLNHVRTRQAGVQLRRAAALAATAVLGVLLAAAATEALAHLSITGRTLLFAGIVLVIAGVVAAIVGVPFLRRIGILPGPSNDAMALSVGSHFPGIRDRLLNVLQVRRELDAATHPAFSRALVDASFAEVAREFAALDLGPIVDTTPARRSARILLIGIGVTTLAAILLPSSLSGALERIIHFRTDYAPPAPFEFLVQPGDCQVVKGEGLTLTASTTAWNSPRITFAIREEGRQEFESLEARVDSAGRHVLQLESVRTGFIYHAEADGYRSRQYRVEVVDRPFVRNLRLRLTFPAYTRMQQQYLDDNTGDVTAVTGTTLGVTLHLNKEVASATLLFSDSQSVPLTLSGLDATGSVRLLKDRTYTIRLVDHAGLENINPVTYTLRAVPDAPPSIALIEPTRNGTLDEQLRVAVLTRIADDYGFSRMLLHYRLAASKFEKPEETYHSVPIPLPMQQKNEMDVPYVWNLRALNLVPEDVMEFYVEVYDNDVVTGPKSARTSVVSVRLPSLDEVYAQADKVQNKAVTDMQKVTNEATQLQKEMESLQREMRQNNQEKPDWQQRRKAEDLVKRQEKMLEKLKEVNEEIARLTEDMQKQMAVTPETMEKYDELRKMMEELNSPQFKDALKQMQDKMPQMNQDQMKQAMENFRMNEEAFKQSVERTIELLKRLQIEQKTDELVKRAEELAQKQEDLANRTENADPKNQAELDKLAKEQQELKKQAEAMQRELDELRKKMEEFPQEMPLGEMKDAQSELNLADMQQQMSQNSSECQGGNCKNAAKGQKKTAQQMKKFQKKMEQVKKKLNEDMKKLVEKGFKKALENILTLSKKQEDLKNRIARLPQNSQQFRDATQEQLETAEELNQTLEDLMELAKKTFAIDPKMMQHLGQAMKKMQQALEKMQERNSQAASDQQGGAMTELNESAKQLSNTMKSSSSSGGSGSMMQQLMQMAGQQQMINMGSMQFGPGGMSSEQAAQMERLMGQQKALQKSLQQLNEEAKKSDEGRRLLGDLEKVDQEMSEVIRDMEQQQMSPETRQKQERILSRLLDASRSMRERDWEKKRKAETAKGAPARNPGELDPSLLDPTQAPRTDLQRAVNEGYSKDYEAMIRKYFEELQKALPGK